MTFLGLGLNFDKQFVNYAEYHNNKINQAIHVIFVPTILWSAQVLLTKSPVYTTWAYSNYLPVNNALICSGFYSLYYLALHRPLGLIATPVLLGCTYYANQFANLDLPYGGPLAWAGAIHLTSWFFQILGHQLYEKRAPAFLDNPLEALVLAPLFVLSEVLFAFGLFPETAKRLNTEASKKAKAFQDKNKRK
ncbi:hypothetical protein BC833DRAFT_595357 [Globomyces pollinis-pini]|nr:hypothetical protein BC833DRAFT_595357 [Globomyces pollinis-pini]KAJ2996264.1 hypothetical protein HDV02_006661 [Globomyces sp. JEL0801]